MDLALADMGVMPTTQVTATVTLTATSIAPECTADQPIAGFNPASIYYYAGKAKILIGDYQTAIAYLQQALAAI